MALIKNQFKKTCSDCKHFDNSGYKDHKQTENAGFCNRWTQTTGKNEIECNAFILSDTKEEYFRNLQKQKDLKIQKGLQQEINFDI